MGTLIKERKDHRRGCVVPIEAKAKSAFGNAQTIDISPGGLGLVLKQAIPVGKTIAVELDLAAGRDSLLVVGEVRWIRKLFGSNQYRAGLFFKRVLVNSSPQQFPKILPQ